MRSSAGGRRWVRKYPRPVDSANWTVLAGFCVDKIAMAVVDLLITTRLRSASNRDRHSSPAPRVPAARFASVRFSGARPAATGRTWSLTGMHFNLIGHCLQVQSRSGHISDEHITRSRTSACAREKKTSGVLALPIGATVIRIPLVNSSP